MTSIEAIIERQCRRWEQQQKARPTEPPPRTQPLPIITVSRQSGSRGSYFASRLAQKLGYQRMHREVIDAVCRSTGYRKRIIEALDEHSRSELETLAEAFITGQSVDHSDYVRHLCKVILSMSHLGGIVLVGRGGNFILGPRRGFHIRFVAPRDRRIANLIAYKQLTEEEAEKSIKASDERRRDFIRQVFDADIDCPLHYDLVMNAEFIDVEELVETTVRAIEGKMDKLAHLDNDDVD
jgi:cytidylate kinase